MPDDDEEAEVTAGNGGLEGWAGAAVGWAMGDEVGGDVAIGALVGFDVG